MFTLNLPVYLLKIELCLLHFVSLLQCKTARCVSQVLFTLSNLYRMFNCDRSGAFKGSTDGSASFLKSCDTAFTVKMHCFGIKFPLTYLLSLQSNNYVNTVIYGDFMHDDDEKEEQNKTVTG